MCYASQVMLYVNMVYHGYLDQTLDATWFMLT
jgi:hypothetical protein